MQPWVLKTMEFVECENVSPSPTLPQLASQASRASPAAQQHAASSATTASPSSWPAAAAATAAAPRFGRRLAAAAAGGSSFETPLFSCRRWARTVRWRIWAAASEGSCQGDGG
jgi:hypothetical protein